MSLLVCEFQRVAAQYLFGRKQGEADIEMVDRGYNHDAPDPDRSTATPPYCSRKILPLPPFGMLISAVTMPCPWPEGGDAAAGIY
jgi:hypothetical protein